MSTYYRVTLTCPHASAPALLAQAFLALHCAIKEPYAVDFPSLRTGETPWLGDRLDVWTQSQETSEAVRAIVQQTEGRVTSDVIQDWKGPWASCKRFRISAKKTKLAEEEPSLQVLQSKHRMNSLQKAFKLPFVHVKSLSNKQDYKVPVERVSEAEGVSIFTPNSYGLSSFSHSAPFPDTTKSV